MPKQLASRPSRCLPGTISKLAYPLIFAILLTVAILVIAHASYPYQVVTTSRDRVLLPLSIQSRTSLLQSQVGDLLKQLRAKHGDTKVGQDVSQQVLAIAVSLDKLAEALSSLYTEPPHADWNTSTVEMENRSERVEEEDGVEQDWMNHRSAFVSREFYNYTSPKPNKNGKKNFLEVDTIYPSVGLSCAGLASKLNQLMSYKPYGPCPDDWVLAQKLMVSGCDPLPRRRCFSKSPSRYIDPLPHNSSLWNLPIDANVRWTHYKCKSFTCLASKKTLGKRGFFKCSDCFNLTNKGWELPTNDESISAEFAIDEVLSLKPGKIRIGLDFSPSTGTFAAHMRARNVTIATATLNLGAPFNEVIALRGLLPLYLSVGSRLPFFDNALDIVHSTLFLDGWINVELLQYVLLDWDRVLRPKGLLWIDRFFCATNEIKQYIDEFERLHYRKLLWRVVHKTDKLGDEVFFSAVLEKPLRP